jgi:RNA polymerase sigma-70 factor, ECF subfamily
METTTLKQTSLSGNASTVLPGSPSLEHGPMTGKKFDKTSDHALMELIKDGDKDAFRQIVQRYRDPVTNYVYRIINDYDTAVDISQEVFLRIFRKASSYEPLAAFSTWIFRIATNLAINEIRRKRKGLTISIFSRLQDYEDGNYEMQFADPSAVSPMEEISQQQIRLKIRESLNSLPLKYRVPLLLRELEGYSYEEIAQIVEIPEGTVKSRINRGRSILQKKLKVLMK